MKKSLKEEKKKSEQGTFSLMEEFANQQIDAMRPEELKLISREQKQHSIMNEMKQAIKDFQEKISSCVESLKGHPRFSEIYPSSEKIKKILKGKSPEEIVTANPLSKLFGISQEALLDIYSFAYDAYLKDDLQKAENIFLLLTILNPFVSAFWAGLGHILFAKKNYEEASLKYSLAFSLDPEDISSGERAIHCLVQQKQRERALALLDSFIEIAEEEHAKKTLGKLKEMKKTLSS
jgi:tetratricopeptide (TPR) repeat protein